MSSIATFYLIDQSHRESFSQAEMNQKTHRMTKGFLGFGRRQETTGERYLWEYLDGVAANKLDFEYSGSALVDYFFTYIQLPEDVQSELAAATSPDGHYIRFEPRLADLVVDCLEQNSPDESSLAEFAEGLGHEASEYVAVLIHTHTILVRWLQALSSRQFAVLHLTF